MAPDRLAMLEMLVSKSPNDPFPYYCHAQELRSRGRGDEALAAFAATRERFPAYVPQYLMAAQLCQELGRKDDARAWLHGGIDAARTARDSHALGELEGLLASLGS